MAKKDTNDRFSDEQVKQFIEQGQLKSMGDVQSALKDLFRQTLKAMLEGEMDHHLGYTLWRLIKVRQEGRIVSKAAYIMIGVDLEGMKEVLGIWIGEAESAKFWMSTLSEIKSRGIQDVLLCCVDNLTGFSEAIKAVFPGALIQKCLVHQVRNSLRYVSHKDAKAVVAGMKAVYTAPSEAAALAALDAFESEWGGKYPLVVAGWRRNWSELATFFGFAPELRRLIYTTNMIESFHRQLRKVTKGKSVFPTDVSLLKMLYLATHDVLRKWTVRIAHWGQILAQLSITFEGRISVIS